MTSLVWGVFLWPKQNCHTSLLFLQLPGGVILVMQSHYIYHTDFSIYMLLYLLLSCCFIMLLLHYSHDSCFWYVFLLSLASPTWDFPHPPDIETYLVINLFCWWNFLRQWNTAEQQKAWAGCWCSLLWNRLCHLLHNGFLLVQLLDGMPLLFNIKIHFLVAQERAHVPMDREGWIQPIASCSSSL